LFKYLRITGEWHFLINPRLSVTGCLTKSPTPGNQDKKQIKYLVNGISEHFHEHPSACAFFKVQTWAWLKFLFLLCLKKDVLANTLIT
jgi:hypothetical protein